jgi:hypothetical protein
MVKIVKVSLTIVLGCSVLFAGSDTMKKYAVKNGKVEYSIKESGNIMGMVKIKGVGKKRLVFDNYGAKDLTEENKVKKETSGGQSKVEKTHTIQYMNGGILYRVDFDTKKIIRMEDPTMVMNAMMGESMLKSMGGKKVGTDKVLGYTCDVWDLMGVKQCIYKGIPLRIESNLMGMKSQQVATKADFDISLSEDDFKLPEFPLVDMRGNILDLDRNSLNELDQKMSQENVQEMQDGMKAMTAAMGALKESGFDMNDPNAQLTKVQQKSMQDAAMAAMGGEDKMLARTKNEILKEAKNLPEIKKCFQNANTVKEANICEMKADNEDPEHHTTWNGSIRSALINEISTFEKALPCIENASSFSDLKQCMPQE